MPRGSNPREHYNARLQDALAKWEKDLQNHELRANYERLKYGRSPGEDHSTPFLTAMANASRATGMLGALPEMTIEQRLDPRFVLAQTGEGPSFGDLARSTPASLPMSSNIVDKRKGHDDAHLMNFLRAMQRRQK
jgi:hypothetical protein